MNHLLTLEDVTPAALRALLARAALLKRARLAGEPRPTPLAGKTIALLFEKPSLRTRVSFEVAARELGASSLYLAPAEVGLGQRESVADVARVLSEYAHAVVIRTFRHATLEEFAAAARVPVINGLTDQHHPCQALADALTMREAFGDLTGRVLAYVGDGNNVAHSLLQVGAKAGMHVRLATPAGYEPDGAIVAAAAREAARTGGSVTLLRQPEVAASGASVLYTDVWASMGQEAEAAARRPIFAPYQLNARLLAHARPDAIVLHPLPAHRGEEITDEVADGPRSRVFDQAGNRLHAQAAVLLALFAHSAATSRQLAAPAAQAAPVVVR
ncbi:MAG TPA: ornithine carbamoyltransferase [Ktedonobacterales bacterium]|jgi:ornithine carbamoyltransferase